MERNMYHRKRFIRRLITLALTVALITGSLGIQPERAEAAVKKVKKVEITSPVTKTLNLQAGMEYQLQTNVSPKSAANRKLSYQSSQASVVSVSETGKLKALKIGKSTITAMAMDGSKKKSTVIVMVVKKLNKTNKVKLNISKATLYLNGKDTVQLTSKIYPANSTNSKVYYVSSDETVATVDSEGNVTARSDGTAVITVYAADGWGKKAECKITVKEKKTTLKPTPTITPTPTATPTPTPIATPTVTPTPVLSAGTGPSGNTTTSCTCNLSQPVIVTGDAIVIPANSANVTVNLNAVSTISDCKVTGHTNSITYTYTIQSDPNKIASITGDKLTVNSEGTVTISITASANGITQTNTKQFTVTKETQQTEPDKNWALASNGGIAKVSVGEGTTDGQEITSIIDGDRSYVNGKRWRTSTAPAYIELHFDALKKINTINLFSQQTSAPYSEPTLDMTSTLSLSSFKFSYFKDGAWVQIGDTVTGNNKVWYQLKLSEAISTTAIRIDIPEAPSGWIRVIEAEAWGQGYSCDCDLGTPSITNDTNITVQEGTGTAITLSSTATYNTDNCVLDGHKGNTPVFTYKIISDTSNVATVTGAAITFSDAGEVVVEVTATLNGVTKTSQTTFTVTKIVIPKNYALTANGATVKASAGEGNTEGGTVTQLNDGNQIGTRWRTSTYDSDNNAWVEIDFDATTTVSQVNVISQQNSASSTTQPDAAMTSNYAITSYEVYYLQDGVWVLAGTVTNSGKLVVSTYNFALPVNTTAIRIKFNKSATPDGWARFMEFEVWGVR